MENNIEWSANPTGYKSQGEENQEAVSEDNR